MNDNYPFGTLLHLFAASTLMVSKGIVTSESRPVIWNLNEAIIKPIWMIKPYN